jgi:hypothetical protein
MFPTRVSSASAARSPSTVSRAGTFPRGLLLSIGMLAPGNPSFGRTLVAPGHCAQRTKEKRRFLWCGLAVRRGYVVKCGQEGRLIP